MKYSEFGDYSLLDPNTASSNLLDGVVELLPGYENERLYLRAIYMTALVRKNAGLPDTAVDDTLSALGTIPGIEVVEDRSFMQDFSYRCAEYTFGTVQKEPWAEHFITEKQPEFWRSTEDFLERKGYQKTVVPTPGDIVAYGGTNGDSRWFGHFGIFEGLGKVVSKFGRGPIIRHDASLIPKGPGRYECHWGDYMWHFTKPDQ
jgi:hypothetical protein